MKRNRLPFAITFALIVAALYLGMFWAGGYNFDRRTPDVAFAYAFGVILVGGTFAMSMISPD